MSISAKEWLVKPHSGQEPMRFFVYRCAFCIFFFSFFEGRWEGVTGPAICLQSWTALSRWTGVISWLLGDSPGCILIRPAWKQAGRQTFRKRRDYISNGARLCLGGLPKELQAAMRAATYFLPTPTGTGWLLQMPRCVTAASEAGDGGKSLPSESGRQEAREETTADTFFFSPGAKIMFNSKWVQSPGCKPAGNIYSCYRATFKGDCVVWSCLQDFFFFIALSRACKLKHLASDTLWIPCLCCHCAPSLCGITPQWRRRRGK